MKGRLSLIILVLINLIVNLGGGRIIFTSRSAMMTVVAIFVLSGIALLVIVIQLTNENDWLRKEVATLKQSAPKLKA